MLPSLATVNQLADRIPGGIDDTDQQRATAALQDASALIRAEAGLTWVDDADELDDVPDVIVAVTIAAARRAFVNPDMVSSETIQDYSATFASASADIYLTKAERKTIRRAAGRTGTWTLPTTRVDVGSDVPTVTASNPPTAPVEATDPFSEGWTG